MNQNFDLAESALPYEVRHSIWDPDEVEAQLAEKDLYRPDSVYLFSVPGSEEDVHMAQVEQLLEDIDEPDTVYFNEDNRETVAPALEQMSGAEQVLISYPEDPSRRADFQALNEYFESEETFLGIAVDYAVPRNQREAAANLEGWNGPENGFPFEVEDEIEKGSSPWMYLVDRLNTRSHGGVTPDFTDKVDMKDGDHFIVGTTYKEDFSDYSKKFGLGSQSELVRSVVPQRAKDTLKNLVNEF